MTFWIISVKLLLVLLKSAIDEPARSTFCPAIAKKASAAPEITLSVFKEVNASTALNDEPMLINDCEIDVATDVVLVGSPATTLPTILSLNLFNCDFDVSFK